MCVHEHVQSKRSEVIFMFVWWGVEQLPVKTSMCNTDMWCTQRVRTVICVEFQLQLACTVGALDRYSNTALHVHPVREPAIVQHRTYANLAMKPCKSRPSESGAACHLGACVLACQLLSVLCVNFSPCDEIKPIKRVRLRLMGLRQPISKLRFNQKACHMQGDPFPVGLVYWPGGLEQHWGSPETGLNPCNPDVQANLVGCLSKKGKEQVIMLSQAPRGAPCAYHTTPALSCRQQMERCSLHTMSEQTA